MPEISLGKLNLTVGEPKTLFAVSDRNAPTPVCSLTPPRFEVNENQIDNFIFVDASEPRHLPRNGVEITLQFQTEPILPLDEPPLPALDLQVIIRAFPGSSFLRFHYALTSKVPVRLTKTGGKDNLRYYSVQRSEFETVGIYEAEETQLSHFDPVAHTYFPIQKKQDGDRLYSGQKFIGPILSLTRAFSDLLVAYEHGADCPNAFLEFTWQDQYAGPLELNAVKGNYHDGQIISEESPFTSIWFQIGVDITADAPDYRQFILEEMCENTESRKPYLFYNTWNHQERLKYFEGKPYLTDMNFDRISAEIDVAHQIGLDVFVIDTGWYGKTGDWEVNLERFPDGLRDIKAKLDSYGMKLGLWFNPIVAAKTSKVYLEHPDYVMSSNGKEAFWGPIWETEDSYGMCLVSDYADTFIETMVRLHRELGVTYFKWDAIGQYGCDSPHHQHGTEANSPQERADCYAYEMGRRMIRIVEEVSRRCPDVIVDFDITEGGRFVGLGFLSVGKYFLVNNGPYFHDFDIPKTVKMEPDTINVFFYPGPARARVCRTGARYDSVIPSILFLTHYLPDGPPLSQWNSLASLMLGGNGIWGDLLSLSPADVENLAKPLRDYKKVADAVTKAYPRVTGFAGSNPEVHEKLDAEGGTGIVVFFTVAQGEFIYVTQALPADYAPQIKGADLWERLPDNRIKLAVTLERNGAKVVFFLPG